MQMTKIYCFRSFALDSAHVKLDVWNGPQARWVSVNKTRDEVEVLFIDIHFAFGE